MISSVRRFIKYYNALWRFIFHIQESDCVCILRLSNPVIEKEDSYYSRKELDMIEWRSLLTKFWSLWFLHKFKGSNKGIPIGFNEDHCGQTLGALWFGEVELIQDRVKILELQFGVAVYVRKKNQDSNLSLWVVSLVFSVLFVVIWLY